MSRWGPIWQFPHPAAALSLPAYRARELRRGCEIRSVSRLHPQVARWAGKTWGFREWRKKMEVHEKKQKKRSFWISCIVGSGPLSLDFDTWSTLYLYFSKVLLRVHLFLSLCLALDLFALGEPQEWSSCERFVRICRAWMRGGRAFPASRLKGAGPTGPLCPEEPDQWLWTSIRGSGGSSGLCWTHHR